MTREEAIDIIKCLAWHTRPNEEDIEQAIKSLEQEPCEDAVSRQTVSYIIKSHIHEIITESGTDKNAHTNAVLRAIVNLVETMPSVTPAACIAKVTFDKDELQKIVDEKVKDLTITQEWIPISERLPKINQRVIVTSYGRVCYAMMISADGNSGYPVFKLQDSLNEKVVCETTVHSKFTTNRITAWMPLPEPYKEDNKTEQGLAYADQDTMMSAT